MKKIASVVVMLSLVAVLFTACGGSKDDFSAVVGTWNTASIEMEGEVLEIDDPMLAMVGFDALLDYSLTFKDDGKVVFAAFGVEEEMSFKLDGSKVTLDDGSDSIELTLDGDTLVMSDESFGGASINFKKA